MASYKMSFGKWSKKCAAIITIKNLTSRINKLTNEFPKETYPIPLSEEEENKRIEATKKQLG